MDKYIQVPIDHCFDEDISSHEGIILGLLIDNFYESETRSVEDYTFTITNLDALKNQMLIKRAFLVPTEIIAEHTDLRSEIKGDYQLVAMLPIPSRHLNPGFKSIGMILQYLDKVCSDMDFMSIDHDLGIYHVERAIDLLMECQEDFWNHDDYIENLSEDEKLIRKIDLIIKDFQASDNLTKNSTFYYSVFRNSPHPWYNRAMWCHRLKNINKYYFSIQEKIYTNYLYSSFINRQNNDENMQIHINRLIERIAKELGQDLHEPGDPTSRWIMGKRIKNRGFTETDDYDIISKIDDQDIQEYQFCSIIKDSSFEDATFFEHWKQSLPFQPLEIEDYTKYLTYQQAETIFRVIYRVYPHKVIKKLLSAFLGSYHLCHLAFSCDIFKNPFMHDRTGATNTYLWDVQERRKLASALTFTVALDRLCKILYYEERLLGGKITSKHRCYNAYQLFTNLPPRLKSYYPFSKILYKLNFYSCANKIINNSSYLGPRDREASILNTYGYSPNKIELVIENINKYTNNLLRKIRWKENNMFLTGSFAELCYFQQEKISNEDDKLYESLLLTNSNSYRANKGIPRHDFAEILEQYANSDIDIAVKVDVPEEIRDQERIDFIIDHARKIAEYILVTIQEESDQIGEITKNENRWQIIHPELNRPIDIFGFSKDPAQLVYNYHIATCRVMIQPDTENPQINALSSGLMSCMIGNCIDRRWFTSKKSLHQRIIKQYRRGIGMILNTNERNVLQQYLKITSSSQDHNNDDDDLEY